MMSVISAASRFGLQALVDDVHRIISAAEIAYTGYRQAGFEFLEYLTRHDLTVQLIPMFTLREPS
jgi:hypothetical protein